LKGLVSRCKLEQLSLQIVFVYANDMQTDVAIVVVSDNDITVPRNRRQFTILQTCCEMLYT